MSEAVVQYLGHLPRTLHWVDLGRGPQWWFGVLAQDEATNTVACLQDVLGDVHHEMWNFAFLGPPLTCLYSGPRELPQQVLTTYIPRFLEAIQQEISNARLCPDRRPPLRLQLPG